MKSLMVRLGLAVLCTAGAVLPTDAAVTIDMVTVGDPGNAADTTGYGAVPYEYQIGKYEVTIGQYCEFLNAAAKSDPYSLYNPSMATDLNIAGISRSGSSGSYTYSVIINGGNSADRPISYVSWWSAARFANWMHNGQGPGDTETGAYTLNGATSGEGPAVNSGAQFYIPTENQWYKAAYYTGGGTNAGYWDYATQSNSAPGNAIGGDANQANYYTGSIYAVTQSSSYSSSQNYLTDVGAFSNSMSAYGTFDQSGSVWEWNDLTGAAGDSRGIRGGAWIDRTAFEVSSSYRDNYYLSVDFGYSLGFRVAAPVAVPEPSTVTALLAGLALGVHSMFRRRKRA